MKAHARASNHLLCVLISYLVLAATDTVHHLHAALVLGYESALHAAIIGLLLTPIALAMFWYFRKNGQQAFVVVFLIIVVVCILIPGVFHGGWHHAVKLIIAFGTSDYENSIEQLLPGDNLHLWFYEISGVIEFIVALVCAYFTIAYFRDKPKQRSNLN